MGLLPSSFVFPFVWGGRLWRGQGAAVWWVLCTQGTRTTQNYRPLKDQRQRKKLAPKPGHLLEVIDYKKKKKKIKPKKTQQVSVYKGTWRSSLSLYKTKIFKFQNIPMACWLWASFCSFPRPRALRLGRGPGGNELAPLSLSLHTTQMQPDGFKNWWLGLRACCVQWEQGRFRSKCTELSESGIDCSSWNVDVLPGTSVRSRSPKFHQGSFPF